MSTQLTRVSIAGFRSLDDVSIELSPLTLLIGPNGSGKTNLLAALEFVERCSAGLLSLHVGLHGGAGFLLRRAPKAERRVAIDVEFRRGSEQWGYSIVLRPTAADSFAFETERVGHAPSGTDWSWTELGQGHTESLVSRHSCEAAGVVQGLLAGVRLFHFHDTSRVSELRSNARQTDDRTLAAHGGNLASIWLRLKESKEPDAQLAVTSIESALRMVVPGLVRLVPTALPGDAARLDWIDDSGERLHIAHLSDGTLRLIALLTALGQPLSMRPGLIALDEPELGLHPAALDLVSEWIRSAAVDTQIIVATQAGRMLHEANPDDVVVVERQDGSTALSRKSAEALSGWLADYDLADLFAMNVLGGRP